MQVVLDLVRQGFGSLRSRRRFALFAIVALGVGIGANSAAFALLNSLFLRELPYQDVSLLVEISVGPAPSPIEELRKAGSFSGVAALTSRGFSVRTGPTYRNLYGIQVTPDLFSLLGVSAAIGRVFEPDDLTLWC
jgi:hypothetical protein